MKKAVLVFNVDRNVAAYSVITGASFYSDDILWDIDVFPYRIPISFKVVLNSDNRIPIDGQVKSLLIESWGKNYGWGINCQHPMKNNIGDKIVALIESSSNSLEFYNANLDDIISQVKHERVKLIKDNQEKFKKPMFEL